MTNKTMLSVEREFKREVRYTVIKHSHLTDSQMQHLKDCIFGEGIPTVEAVVVESDWPEYEPVWRMIKRRIAAERNKSARATQVWHQDSPGMKVWVVRGWWGRLLRNKDFASIGEKTYPTNPESHL